MFGKSKKEKEKEEIKKQALRQYSKDLKVIYDQDMLRCIQVLKNNGLLIELNLMLLYTNFYRVNNFNIAGSIEIGQDFNNRYIRSVDVAGLVEFSTKTK